MEKSIENIFSQKSSADTLDGVLWKGPAILLVDLDAFFASVEQLDHPEWKGLPVIVGGSPTKRGVVSTASYEARAFGVHSAMPSSTAMKLCPDAILVGGNFSRYRELSRSVMGILQQESPLVEQVSIDEAFVDISPTRINHEHPLRIAQRIQDKVDKLGISCSIGLGTSKTIAKIASNKNKPHGLTTVFPGEETAFLAPLPIAEMSGIGPKSQKKLKDFGIKTVGDLSQAEQSILQEVFGKNANRMRQRALGIDLAVSATHDPAKSVSHEISLAQSTNKRKDLEALVATAAHKVGRRMRQNHYEGSILQVKIRYENLTIRTCQRKIVPLDNNELTWIPYLNNMLDEVWNGYDLVRLVGVGVSGFNHEPLQATLFGTKATPSVAVSDNNAQQAQSTDKQKLLEATDRIAERFGEGGIAFGHELRMKHATTESTSQNPEDFKTFKELPAYSKKTKNEAN